MSSPARAGSSNAASVSASDCSTIVPRASACSARIAARCGAAGSAGCRPHRRCARKASSRGHVEGVNAQPLGSASCSCEGGPVARGAEPRAPDRRAPAATGHSPGCDDEGRLEVCDSDSSSVAAGGASPRSRAATQRAAARVMRPPRVASDRLPADGRSSGRAQPPGVGEATAVNAAGGAPANANTGAPASRPTEIVSWATRRPAPGQARHARLDRRLVRRSHARRRG